MMGFVCFFFVFIFYLLVLLLSVKIEYYVKLRSFECGFNSLGFICRSFSVHFFIMMLMFVIFDLEVIMFLRVVVSSYRSVFSYAVLLFFVVFGFYME